ncbi:MAG: sulfite exporter TauE/SafE family protein [Calditrichaeota bacterium]|nr:sulfite exporter TauE/SafE family protein [Calditrichota bacterium]MCB9368930.1 sulfite exporter TauE/SafE family protein [Calditrichota bacterium]
MNSFAVDIVPAFVVGLLSSAHCIGMCGPLATLGCRSKMTGGAWAPLGFSLGKLVSYSLLGLAAASLGAIFMDQTGLQKATAWVSIVGGVLMIVALILAYVLPTSGGFLAKISVAMSKRALRWGKLMSPGLGLAAAFLPCGVLYAMVARSAAASTPVNGMLIMQAFGIGTMPALLGLGALIKRIPARFSRYGNVAASALIAITAIVLLWRGMAGLAADHGPPPCCGGH